MLHLTNWLRATGGVALSSSETTLPVEGQAHGDSIPTSTCGRDLEACPYVETDGGVEKMHVQRHRGKPAALSFHQGVEQRPADSSSTLPLDNGHR